MQPARTAEGRIPFLDVSVGGVWIDAADAVAVQFGVPNHSVHRRVVETVGCDASRLAFACGDCLVGSKEVIFLHFLGFRMKRETRVAAGIRVPDQAFRVFRINPQGMWIGSATSGSLGAGMNLEFLGVEVVFRHLAGGAHGDPHMALVVRFDGVWAVGPARKLLVFLFAGHGVQGDQVMLRYVYGISETARGLNFQVVKG